MDAIVVGRRQGKDAKLGHTFQGGTIREPVSPRRQERFSSSPVLCALCLQQASHAGCAPQMLVRSDRFEKQVHAVLQKPQSWRLAFGAVTPKAARRSS